jgi:nitrate reductase gamma subunit
MQGTSYAIYVFLTGPLFWASLVVCLIGLAVRVILYIRGLDWQLDRVAYRAHPKLGAIGALRSIGFWLVPFGSRGWRRQPFMTVIFFGFHAGVVLVPLFLAAHNQFLAEKTGISLRWTLGATAADMMSWTVIICALLLLVRRLALAEVRILTTPFDLLILALATAPFITGLLARYEAGNYSFWLMAHILSGEILLIAVPFTKLSHVVLFFATRAQLGMDYAIKRGGQRNAHLTW